MTIMAFDDVVREYAIKRAQQIMEKLERDVAMAVAFTPVQYRHRITIVYQDGYDPTVACLRP